MNWLTYATYAATAALVNTAFAVSNYRLGEHGHAMWCAGCAGACAAFAVAVLAEWRTGCA